MRVAHGPPTPDDFADFVKGSQRRLIHLADLLTGDRGRAEDLVQHALVKVHLSWPRLRSGNPEAYARTVLVHASVDLWRRRRWVEESDTKLMERPAPADHAADLAQRDAVMRALALLTRRERAVLVLRYYADLSELEIAREIGCRTGTVKSTSARAIAKLRGSPHLQQEIPS